MGEELSHDPLGENIKREKLYHDPLAERARALKIEKGENRGGLR